MTDKYPYGCKGYRDKSGVFVKCLRPVGPVMDREVGQGQHTKLCRRCADKRRALGEQERATVPPEEPKRYEESNGYMENDYGTVYPYP